MNSNSEVKTKSFQITDLLQLSHRELKRKKQVRTAIFFYRLAKRQRLAAFQDYIENLPGLKISDGGAQ